MVTEVGNLCILIDWIVIHEVVRNSYLAEMFCGNVHSNYFNNLLPVNILGCTYWIQKYIFFLISILDSEIFPKYSKFLFIYL